MRGKFDERDVGFIKLRSPELVKYLERMIMDDDIAIVFQKLGGDVYLKIWVNNQMVFEELVSRQLSESRDFMNQRRW